MALSAALSSRQLRRWFGQCTPFALAQFGGSDKFSRAGHYVINVVSHDVSQTGLAHITPVVAPVQHHEIFFERHFSIQVFAGALRLRDNLQK
jgi:hypothetical protein